jgi:NAD-dependent deacetylase
MHGSLYKKKRTDINKVLDWGSEPLNPDWERPDVVLFGEDIQYGHEIDLVLNSTDLFITVGTSMTVFPAADFVLQVKNLGGYTIFTNVEKCFLDVRFHKTIYGKSSEILPKLVDDIINNNLL